MNPEIKYYYANFLCKQLDQYIRVIVVIYADISNKNILEDFWRKYKIISEDKPIAEWNKATYKKFKIK